MALLFPAINQVKENARKAQAKNDIMQVVAAVKAYNTEYGRYPDVSEKGAKKKNEDPNDTMVGDSERAEGGGGGKVEDNNTLFDTLRALDQGVNEGHTKNPRRVVFMEGKSVAKPEQPRGGFVERTSSTGSQTGSSKKGCFFDPWGTQYFVIMDTDYDNMINVADQYKDFKHPEESPRTGVGAWALGKDQKPGSKDVGEKQFRKGSETADDVISWQ